MSFKSFPISSDLVSFTDQHFHGVSGAHRMLLQISSDIHRLDAGHNTLGTDGAIALFDGLAAARRRFSALSRSRSNSGEGEILNVSPLSVTSRLPEEDGTTELWGMTEINLARNGVGDEGMLAASYYVSKDQCMRELLLQDNMISLADVVDAVVERLNSSHLQKLSLSSNPLHAPAVVTFFEGLNAPKLSELHISACSLPASCVASISDFIRSPRSQTMGLLELNGNTLSRLGVTAILDALEIGNFSISRIGLFANNSAPARSYSPDQGAGYFGDEDAESVWESDESMSRDDPRSMANQIERRVPALQKRNGRLTLRVRSAAARCIAPTRIILHARPPTAVETAARVIEDTRINGSAPAAQFPLLEFPVEVQILIARHCSGDADALSEAQWVRLRSHAADRDTLSRLAARTRKALSGVAAQGPHIAKRYKDREVRDSWLTEVGCEWWELDNKRYWEELERLRG